MISSLDSFGQIVNTAHMIGQTFDQLTVLFRAANDGSRAMFVCQCSCGKKTTTSGTRLRSGKTKSCGCRRSENMRKIAKKHGNSAHPLYVRWLNMHNRCYDPAHNRYYRYGGRGIFVCERWHDFNLYLEDVLPTYREGLTLDRIDNDGSYSPDDFRWASYRVQARNRPACVVTEKEIADMRRMYVGTGCTQKEVGEAFGYSRDTVKHYLRNLRA
jgi:DNA-binding CsgD family transcriptional regulator